MWEIICATNLNLFLIAFGVIAASIVTVAVLWVPINKAKDLTDRLMSKWLEPKEVPIHETGVGEIVPDAILKEREAWEELVNVFDFGGQSDV